MLACSPCPVDGSSYYIRAGYSRRSTKENCTVNLSLLEDTHTDFPYVCSPLFYGTASIGSSFLFQNKLGCNKQTPPPLLDKVADVISLFLNFGFKRFFFFLLPKPSDDEIAYPLLRDPC